MPGTIFWLEQPYLKNHHEEEIDVGQVTELFGHVFRQEVGLCVLARYDCVSLECHLVHLCVVGPKGSEVREVDRVALSALS
jgi:hypothetical protein